MKKLLFLLLASTELCAQSGWQVLSSSFSEDLNTTFINSTGVIFIGSDLGNIYYSQDAGATWQTATSPAQDGISDILFTTATEAWAVGDDGLILHSTDGGITWTGVSSGVAADLQSIAFADASTAYIAARDGSVLKSTDGGSTWAATPTGSSNRLESIYFTSTSTGFVAGRDGDFLTTTDGGSTWSNINLGSDDNKSLFFLSADTGFVGGENGIFKTMDGGSNWNPVATNGFSEVNTIYFGSHSHAYGVGENGLIVKSTDGGNNWNLDTSITGLGNLELEDVFFFDANTGIAVGEAGSVIVRTGQTVVNDFCSASFWLDTAISGGGDIYLINNSVPAAGDAAFTSTYAWSFGDGSTSSLAYPTHTYSNSGAFEVCLTISSLNGNGDACFDTFCDTLGLDSLGNLLFKTGATGFTLHVIDSNTTIGMEEQSTVEDLIYPNPATDKLHLDLPPEWKNVQVRLISMSGAIVMMESYRSGRSLDVGSLQRGLYILEIRSEDGFRQQREKLLLK